MFIISEESKDLLKPAAKVEDRQGLLTCFWKKFICVIPRRCEEETRGEDSAVQVPKGQRPSESMSEVGPQYKLCCRDFVQGFELWW